MPYVSFHVPQSVTASTYKRTVMIVGLLGLTPILTILFLHFTKSEANTSSLLPSLIPAVVLGAFIAWRYAGRMKTWRQNMSRYEVRIEEGKYISTNNPRKGAPKDASILEDAAGLNWLTLTKEEIGSIVYFEGRQIIITGRDGSITVPLSTKLSPFDELLKVLNTLGTVERKSGNQFLALRAIVEYIPALGLICALLVDNLWLSLSGAVLGVIGYGYHLYVIKRVHIGGSNKRKAVLKAILFTASLLLVWRSLNGLL